MKFLNKVLCLTAFFAMGSVSAKRTGGASATAAAPVTPGTPAGRPAAQPATQVKTYKQLHDSILRMNKSNVIDSTSEQLLGSFVVDMISEVEASRLGEVALVNLLQVARDKFVTFSGNDNNDLNLLTSINNQINDAKETLR